MQSNLEESRADDFLTDFLAKADTGLALALVFLALEA
jgi:hypothetical protein